MYQTNQLFPFFICCINKSCYKCHNFINIQVGENKDFLQLKVWIWSFTLLFLSCFNLDVCWHFFASSCLSFRAAILKFCSYSENIYGYPHSQKRQYSLKEVPGKQHIIYLLDKIAIQMYRKITFCSFKVGT